MTAAELIAAIEQHTGRQGRRRGHTTTLLCPVHDDHHPSLDVREGNNGKPLVHCRSRGCAYEQILKAVGLAPREDEMWTPRGPAIAIYPYVDERGALLFQVCRTADKKFPQRRPDPTSKSGWRWNLKGVRRVLYRLPQVLAAVEAGETIYVCEGEKDVEKLGRLGVVATCNPMGAGKWKADYSKVLGGADVVIFRDKDDEGRAHADEVASSLAGVAKSVHLVEPAEGKDATDHVAAGGTLDSFVPVPPPEDPEYRNSQSEAASSEGKGFRVPDPRPPGKPPALALEKDILGRFKDDLRVAGVAGEELLAQLLYLALTSRVLPWGKPTERPVSMTPKGSTSTGKSHTTKTTLRFFPPSAYIDLGSMSKRYLFYTDEEFAHRFLYVPEWAAIKDDEELVAMLRTLLSEGRIIHGTVERVGSRNEPRRIEKKGPTGLLMTTTDAAVDPELETRCLSTVTDDSREQTRRVFETLAELEDDPETAVDFAAWHELQEWIAAHNESCVAIPFVRALAKLMPNSATRLRRDFETVLCLVRAHALLYRAQREEDAQGRVIATVWDDYAPVCALVAEVIAEGVEASVSKAMRDTVEAVAALIDDGDPYVSPSQLTNRLGVGQSATYDRIRRALLKGYLVDEATKDERRKKLVVGTPLPGAGEFLPTADAVFRVYSDRPPGRESGSTMRDSKGNSGIPVIPAEPPEEQVDGASEDGVVPQRDWDGVQSPAGGNGSGYRTPRWDDELQDFVFEGPQ